ncbi:hypothetical protein E1267_08300 [Nonomuraea longispora]|uniref:Uncharacterized protein n=1 Tax=Nonomuraea longispora TaxID=1848320 RepID=A0A4R4NJ80_9ACTN|nr:hypothetical protein [Nonomuraea longispora]TDC09135.1 hypothetical protein E1267_08300 [Nonomuraea longispora]
MLTDELRRPQPHEVHARGVRPGAPPPSWGEDQNGDPPPPEPARSVHRLRRIRQVSVQAITEIDQALRHRAQ